MSEERKNYYEILGVGISAGQDEIKKAYRKLASKYHPDNNNGVESEEFPEVSEAYKALIDPVSRQKYDNYSEVDEIARQQLAASIREYITKSIASDENPQQPILFSAMVDWFKKSLADEIQLLSGFKDKKTRLVKMTNKVNIVNCDDIYPEVLKSIQAGLNSDIKTTVRNIKMFERINEMLVDYEIDEDLQRFIDPTYRSTGFGITDPITGVRW